MTSQHVAEANGLKSKAGVVNDKNVSAKLEELREKGVIKSVIQPLKIPHPGFTYKLQYKADFVIETYDDKWIIVRTSASVSSDRTKTHFYDLDGISKYSEYSDNIIASIYAIADPTTTRNKNQFITLKKNFTTNSLYSPATHILTNSGLFDFLEEYKSSVLGGMESEGYQLGRKSSLDGIYLERSICQILNCDSHLNSFRLRNSPASWEQRVFNAILDKIIDSYSLMEGDVDKVQASDTVPVLDSGGPAKADLVVTIQSSNGDEITETISVKNTDKTNVSAHEYKYHDFIKVLDIDGNRLADYIKLFAKDRSFKRIKARDYEKQGFSLEEFQSLYTSEIKRRLYRWAVMGLHDDERLIDPVLQISRFIVFHHKATRTLSIHNSEEYIDLAIKPKKILLDNLSWTVPSGDPNKERITLKIPVIFEVGDSKYRVENA